MIIIVGCKFKLLMWLSIQSVFLSDISCMSPLQQKVIYIWLNWNVFWKLKADIQRSLIIKNCFWWKTNGPILPKITGKAAAGLQNQEGAVTLFKIGLHLITDWFYQFRCGNKAPKSWKILMLVCFEENATQCLYATKLSCRGDRGTVSRFSHFPF